MSYTTKRHLKIDPRPIINADYKKVFGKDINWNEPKDLIEKIGWLQVYSDTNLWTKCADKFKVREFVKEKGCAETLNKLYGVWKRPEDIEWDRLPESFVIKTNNSCGQILLVSDKDKLNREQTIKDIKAWMKTPYGLHNAQLHYVRIDPCIIVEELLKDNNSPGSSLVDYKIWCFHGQPECILVAYGRKAGDYSLSMFDIEWNNISDRALNKQSPHYCGKDCEKPKSLEHMLNYAKRLSDGFPEVRVDFYEINGKPYFGELTFTTGYGSYDKDFYIYLGSKIHLDQVRKLDRINTI